jgi:hypothetical protein
MSKLDFERRLSAVERELERIKSSLGNNGGSTMPWWEKIAGTFEGDAAFLEAMRLGARFRRSTRPKSVTRRKPRHGRT